MAKLWKGSRNKLNEFYKEFRTVMRKYCFWIPLENNRSIWKMPWDLFGFNFEMQEYQDVTVFIEFITTIKERRGWYFYDHNFHEDIYTKILL